MDRASSRLAKGSDDRFPVARSGKYLRPDNSRMLLRPFLPGGDRRVREIIQRILGMSPSEVEAGLQDVMRCLSHQHAGIDAVFSDRYRQLAHLMPPAEEPSPPQSLLIGAYFMSEYSLQSAALFNPSIVPHPDQEDVPAGALRFVMSLRATGEGHLSSIEFREGLISVDGDLSIWPGLHLGHLARDSLPALSQSRLRRNPAGTGNRRAFRCRRVRRPCANVRSRRIGGLSASPGALALLDDG